MENQQILRYCRFEGMIGDMWVVKQHRTADNMQFEYYKTRLYG